jgi:DNA-binding XRE family transcriptional regulator
MGEAGTCPACREARLPGQGRPLCAACTDAARQIVPRPLWMFDSALLRTALAHVNLPAVPAIIRAASGLSQSDLAAIVGWSRSALGLYEHGQRGAVFDIRVVLQFADAVDMPREALLPLVLGDDGAGLAACSPADELGADVDRRSFGGLTAGVAVAAMLPGTTVPSRVTASHVKYLQACVDSLYSRDRAIGGAALLRSALRQWQRARRMLNESNYTETIGRQLLVLNGSLADLSGWLAFDAANVPLAAQLYSEALKAATSADDPVLVAWVLAHQSGLSSYQASAGKSRSVASRRMDYAREGLLLADRAAEEARYAPMPQLHTLIALRHAYAAALLGNTAAFCAAITRSRRELDRGPGIDEPAWVSEVDERNIIEEQARGAMNLGEPARAEKLYRDLLDRELAPRARAFLGARLAGSMLGQGARREAVTAGGTVLTAIEGGVSSIRTLKELRPVRVEARRIGADEFCTRFDAAERALNGFHPAQ